VKKIIIVFIFATFLLSGCSENVQTIEYIPYEQIDFDAIIIDETDPDYVLLKNAEHFAYSGVGLANQISEEIYAYVRIMEKENARDYFYKLEREAT